MIARKKRKYSNIVSRITDLEIMQPDEAGDLTRINLIKDLLKEKNFAQVAWAAHEGKIVDRKKKDYLKWEPSGIILPVSKSMNDYFYSTFYRSSVSEYRSEFDFVMEEGYEKQFTNQWRALSQGGKYHCPF